MAESIHNVLIVGISSLIGREIAKALVDEQGLHVSGTYRQYDTVLEELESLYASRDKKISLDELDVTNRGDVQVYFQNKHDYRNDSVLFTVVYCCGMWICGRLTEIEDEKQDKAIAVGLLAPIDIVKCYLKKSLPGKIFVLTGLGGEKNSVRGNSMFSIITNGVYSLIRSAGMEVADTDTSCIGIGIGLFDKGQNYIYDLCAHLSTGKPTPMEEVRDFIVQQILLKDRALNGSIVELSTGMFNYERAIELFESGWHK
jgi:NAD(P)-dependent dehydrogenase (short-subunit alcohol dehydrogenase family)